MGQAKQSVDAWARASLPSMPQAGVLTRPWQSIFPAVQPTNVFIAALTFSSADCLDMKCLTWGKQPHSQDVRVMGASPGWQTSFLKLLL
jgi:hypothetical protein